MLVKIFDLLGTICQSFQFIWICNSIVSKSNKISKVKSFVLFALIFSNITFFTTYSNIDPLLANILSLLVILVFLILFFNKSILDAFTGFFLSYFLITVTTYFASTGYEYYFSKLNLNISPELSIVIFAYIPMLLFYPIFYIFRKYILNTGMFLKQLKFSLIIIQLMTYALIFFNTLFMEMVTNSMTFIFKAILYIVSFVIFIFAAIYFAKISDKSKELEILNEALNNKIVELKKIKHDYGSEISSLYGLYQLGKIDRLGELLKDIVERNQAVTPAVNVTIQSNPLVTSVLNSAVAAGINVINLDSGEYENLSITENELLKLISNIIKNSVDALANIENPVIKYKSYNNSNGIVIIISNNGPEIPQEVRSRIFEAGYSTKDRNSGDRGYGLSIVKDIIDRYNGKISIRSNRESTQFVLEIPHKLSDKKKLAENM